jgi:hypothetical protein
MTRGGMGGGGNPNGSSLQQTMFGPADSAQPNSTVAKWFLSLDEEDQQRFLERAVHDGLFDGKGQPFTPEHFLQKADALDYQLKGQGLSEDDKILALREVLGETTDKDAPNGGAAIPSGKRH